ncbi:MAG: type II 3-dehydroquinate dehydratase [Clostridia bacterium]|nr:type II 3-dehydroquinate dehydratase [Clostridia bacterium]
MKILVINGPNLNMLGKREPEIYGSRTLADINADLAKKFANVEFEFYQSNCEGDIITAIHECAADGIILNAGAYTHYSYAIHDAIKSVTTPVIEVHLSNIYKREEYRHKSVIASACKGGICGFGEQSYALAVTALIEK